MTTRQRRSTRHLIRLACRTVPLVLAMGCSDYAASSAAARPALALGDPGDRVTIETDREIYGRGEEIVVTVRNRLDTAITTRDQRAFCTIVGLERESEEEWQEVRNCISGAPPRQVTLAAGSDTSVKLAAGTAPYAALDPGRYRVNLVYSPGDRFTLSPENSFVATSAPFEVR